MPANYGAAPDQTEIEAMSITITGGSDKQNAWASSIATQWLAEVDKEIATVALRQAAGDGLVKYAADLQLARQQLLDGCSKASAKQIIDLHVAKLNMATKLLNRARGL